MSDKYAALKQAAERAIAEEGDIWWDQEQLTRYPDTMEIRESDADFIEAASPATILDLLAEREADKARIAELTGKPAEDYPDDSELCFVIGACDDLQDYQTAQWLKELRRRRAAGITLETGE